MRIAFNTFPNSLTNQLATLSAQQNRLQNQAATGKRFSQLEDDPATMRQVLNLQTQDSQIAQYRKNIASLQSQATSSYSAMSGLQDLCARAGEIATLADGTKSPQELQTYATEVSQLIQQGVQLMNTRSSGIEIRWATARRSDRAVGGSKNKRSRVISSTVSEEFSR